MYKQQKQTNEQKVDVANHCQLQEVLKIFW